MGGSGRKSEDRRADGLEIYKQMFGEERAQRRLSSTDPDDNRVTELLLEHAYGTVWNNERLTRRERSLITIALLAGLGRVDELETHILAACNNGCTMGELHEVMIHTGLYCGFPATLSGHRALKKTQKS